VGLGAENWLDAVKITMVKKRLADGTQCRKCAQTEEMLRNRGVRDQIDEVVWAVEGDSESRGMKLAASHGVETAPFFIVNADDGSETVYVSALQLLKELFPARRRSGEIPAAEVGEDDLAAVASSYLARQPQDILRWGLERHGERCVIAFSGAEDVVLVDMAAKTGLPFAVCTVDTGRLHPETYEYLETVRTRYAIELRVAAPHPEQLQALVRTKGLFSFYQDGHQECCGIRKVEPLRRMLGSYDAWVTGQRRDQSLETRADLRVIEQDPTFEGRSGPLVKINPLTAWTSAEVWSYIREHELPFNPLHERGYRSIGCAPCTRPITPGQHEREGRWWWEDAQSKECGLHAGNLATKPR
jgi:phosphoadenosine phosphosulfate reductase